MSQHQPRKRFGQNFLQNQHIIDSIVTVIAPRAGEQLVEIGPGQGALTLPILRQAGALIAIELDRDLVQPLQARCQSVGQLTVYSADALTFDFATLTTAGQKLRIFGNLPYNISTPLIFHLLTAASHIQDMHFMLQKEVVARMAALPNTPAYGRLSVMVQYLCRVEALLAVPASAFYPQPKVESAIVRLTPHAVLPFAAKNVTLFSDIVRLAFMHRRKTLSNSLRSMIAPHLWPLLGINASLRAEQLSVADFVSLCNKVETLQQA